jgi:hypothetical protein
MELLTNDSLLGIFFFILGMISLSLCNILDQKNHYKIRNLRRLELYGRRELDAKATLPLDILGSFMTVAGSSFAIYGLVRFFGSVL